MKDSAIRQMLYGQRRHTRIFTTKEHYKLLNEIIKRDDAFRNKLNPELLELYKKVLAALETSHKEEIDTNYIEGFKLGFLFGLEILEE
jgi:hypothetical protein